jgi:hypothetical protein
MNIEFGLPNSISFKPRTRKFCCTKISSRAFAKRSGATEAACRAPLAARVVRGLPLTALFWFVFCRVAKNEHKLAPSALCEGKENPLTLDVFCDMM